uniref:Uncharacterized protein n=1 Tax=viral metagenome TaxID=1070528 RepID=A0A2V0RLM8_9ZZZZ
MTVLEDTKRYAIDIAEASLNAFQKQARGTIQAPANAENVRLFTAKGGSAVTLASTTDSACVIFDPEATLRNGQLNVVVYERDAGVVTAVQSVNLGRPSEEFLSAGVLSSGLKVFNSSGVDVIGGTQSAAVLSSVPRDVSTMTSTDLSNFCPNHERDLASGVVSREDSTLTLALTSHYGTKMCLARQNTQGNLVQRVWDDGIGARRTTSGQSLGPSAVTVFDALTGTARSDAQIIAGLASDGSTSMAGTNLIDTANLDAANNPLTLATFSASFEGTFSFVGPNTGDTNFTMDMTALALDAAGVVITSLEMRDVKPITSGENFIIRASGSLTSATLPIHRVIFAVRDESTTLSNLDFSPADSSTKITAFEETSDLPARAVHATVLEGLNASATLNLGSFAVLTGVPDSTNVFISQSSSDDTVYDDNAVKLFLRSITKVMPRAFTIDGHSSFTRELTAMYGSEETTVAFQAMSFAKTADRVKKLAKIAKSAGRDMARVLAELEPMMDVAGASMSMLPGPAGMAGTAMASGANLSRRMRGM